jgi:hypothetical protein
MQNTFLKTTNTAATATTAKHDATQVTLAVKFDRAGPTNGQPLANNGLLTLATVPAADGSSQQQPTKQSTAANANLAVTGKAPAGAPAKELTRDPNGKFTDDEILEAFVAFDLDKNNFVGAAEIRHVLINIGEQVSCNGFHNGFCNCNCRSMYNYLLDKLFKIALACSYI